MLCVSCRQVFCWMDRWHGLTMEDIRAIEDRTKEELDKVRKLYFLVFILSQVFSLPHMQEKKCIQPLFGTFLRYKCGNNINLYCPEIGVVNLLVLQGWQPCFNLGSSLSSRIYIFHFFRCDGSIWKWTQEQVGGIGLQTIISLWSIFWGPFWQLLGIVPS